MKATNHKECPTPEKRQYHTKSDAEEALERTKRDDNPDRPTAWALHIYNCPSGKHLHIGKPLYDPIVVFVSEWRGANYFRNGDVTTDRDRNRERFFSSIDEIAINAPEAFIGWKVIYKCQDCHKTYEYNPLAFVDDLPFVEHSHGRKKKTIEDDHRSAFRIVTVGDVLKRQAGLRGEMISHLEDGGSIPDLVGSRTGRII